MTASLPLVTIFGGSGFVGRYIAQKMARAGWRVRVAVRRPNEALFVRTYGVVGQVEPVQANVRDETSTRAAVEGADAVVNCVGILVESGKQSFDAVHAEAAGRIARLAAAAEVSNLVQISALGADASSASRYARSKAAGEAAVKAAFPDAVILRPSVIFGTEDSFFNRFAAMARAIPWVLPIVGRDTMFQPVYVGDVAGAAEHALTRAVRPGTYELGGPETASFGDLMQRMLRIIRRRRLLVSLPFWAARIDAACLDAAQFVSGGLFTNTILTRDQVVQLRHDNVVSGEFGTFADLGITPSGMEGILEGYLYCYRPHGQYDAITDSAKNLKV
ncbi:MAG: complex I NDUFA9 subunit family protein [Paracoccaceae bacterium]